MALSRKHFREIAKILGSNLSYKDDDSKYIASDLINAFVSFCASQNQYFQKQTFIDAIEKEMKDIKKSWPQPIEIDKAWIPFLVEDIANVNLEAWKDELKKK